MRNSGSGIKVVISISAALFFCACTSSGQFQSAPEIIPVYHQGGKDAGESASGPQLSVSEVVLPEPELSVPDLSEQIELPTDSAGHEQIQPVPLPEAEDASLTVPREPGGDSEPGGGLVPLPPRITSPPQPTPSPRPAPPRAVTPLPAPRNTTAPLLAGKPAPVREAPIPVVTPVPVFNMGVPAVPVAATEGQSVKQTELYCKPGDEIQIILPEEGWLFTGFEAVDASRGIAFLGRESAGRESGFVFKTRATGDYLLKFLLQDHSRGTSRQEHYLVRVRDAEAVQAHRERGAATPTPDTPAADPLTPGSPSAEEYYEQGEYIRALAEYLKNYDQENFFANDRIARIYEKLGDLESAVKYWQRNRGAIPPFSTNATAGLMRIAVKTEDLDALLANIEGLSTPEVLSEQEYIEVAAFLAGKEKLGLSLDLLNRALGDVSNPLRLAEVYFLLAGIYAQDSPYRDFRKSREYYTIVRDRYPESPFAPDSEAKIDYLNRHFFFMW